MKNDLSKLMRSIGYTFKEEELLEVALSHRSLGKTNNERLEFLGDALVNFFVGEALFQTYPNYKEGRLSRTRAALVNGEHLASIAKSMSIGDYLRLGQGELKSGGFRRHSILADSLEAIVGAIYLDSDIESCRKVVLTWYGDQIECLGKTLSQKDPKTSLQEFLQANKIPLPEYEVVSVEGESHDQVFTVKCKVKGVDACTEGEARSRRKAEQIAAEKFLEILKNEAKKTR